MANTHKLIQTYRLTSTQNTVTFSSIPQTYTDLKLIISARGTRAGVNRTYINININGLTTSQTYVRAIAYAASSWVSDFDSVNQNYVVMTANNSAIDTYGMSELYFPNYTDTSNYKTINVTSAALDSVNTEHMCGIWGAVRTSTSAITSISLVPDVGDFSTNSVFSLYGIKNS